ncbi:hypothetical protein L598_006100000030 [Mesorhizobium sp. J18]|uniref:hypothetical protein n=1 Tax=Mesorhizobium sp. J18 TaxID=935263 RepID=UPI00119BFFDF|nr:hypothetical protein [Mesorhizobium sp. J18]TWG91028.1 hypothetical protein L598_006100000030 [Mesorhizobium sp. J18]
MATSYDKRRDEEGLWAVYDAESEEVVIVDGMPLSGLDEDEANDAIPRLGSGEITPDNIPDTV